jgi:hypothetical protein
MARETAFSIRIRYSELKGDIQPFTAMPLSLGGSSGAQSARLVAHPHLITARRKTDFPGPEWAGEPVWPNLLYPPADRLFGLRGTDSPGGGGLIS